MLATWAAFWMAVRSGVIAFPTGVLWDGWYENEGLWFHGLDTLEAGNEVLGCGDSSIKGRNLAGWSEWIDLMNCKLLHFWTEPGYTYWSMMKRLHHSPDISSSSILDQFDPMLPTWPGFTLRTLAVMAASPKVR